MTKQHSSVSSDKNAVTNLMLMSYLKPTYLHVVTVVTVVTEVTVVAVVTEVPLVVFLFLS